MLVSRLDGVDGVAMQSAAQGLVDVLGNGAAVVLGGLPNPESESKVILVSPKVKLANNNRRRV